MKYHNSKVVTSYGSFDSEKEHKRFLVLLSKERSGKISDLKRQVPFTLIPPQPTETRGTERAVKYIADFVYEEDGKIVVEDVKGFRTTDYIIKRKLMLFVHGVEIREV
jgi:hypothetical protein